MTDQVFKNMMAKAKADYTKEKNQIIKSFCDANNPYKIGDVFTDHIGSIRVQKIGYNRYGSVGCVYNGIILRKDGTETKKREIRQAWQSNEVKS